MVQEHYFKRLDNTIRNHWEKPALCFFNGETITFGQLAGHIQRFHVLFEGAGFEKGDKISLCAKNTNRWAVAFLSVGAYGTVIVPILADFHPDSVNNLVDHSDSVLLFTDSAIWPTLNVEKMPKLKAVINVDDFSLLFCRDEKFQNAFDTLDATMAEKYPGGVKAEDVYYYTDDIKALNIINYTSGTTSAPKGVMLTYDNVSASVDFAHRRIPFTPGETIVSMLPMAHIYGLVFEFLYPVTGGAAVYFLGKSPAASLLLKAMSEVKPYLVLTVPLVMEKIYKNKVKPALEKPAIKILSAIPGLNKIVFNKVRATLDAAFGGNVREFVMGGAALNPEVEDCFHKIGLHYTVGYGMTEAAPLIAYEDWWEYSKRSCGKRVDCEEVRIDSEDPEHIAGEILAKGDNICLGYYKNEEATAAAFTSDGFLRTGDLGVMDKKGNIYIKGRCKTMILSANGQNIYPEELEATLNNQPYVAESVVVDRSSKLVALLCLDQDAIKKAGLDAEAVADIPETVRRASNKTFPGYSQIAKVEVVTNPFEKTPKGSIKRFLYK